MTVTAILPIESDARAAHAALTRAIERLPEEQRLVLALFHFERLSLDEVAMVLDESEDEVAARLYLAYVEVGMIEPSAMVAAPELQVA